MKLIYIAGPFTAPTPWEIEQNVRRAEEAGLAVAEFGAMPVIPHANTRFFHGLLTPEFWYEGTAELLRRCDAVLFLPGWEKSTGCRTERLVAEEHDIPYFFDEVSLRRWLEVT